MAAYYLGIDAGGSRTRAALATSSGEVIATGAAGPANFRTGSWRQAAKEVRTAVEMAIRPHGVQHVRAVCLGTAGLETPGNERDGRRLLGDVVTADKVVLDTDAYIAWAGSLAGKAGISVIAGTGSICLAVDATGRRHRVGGWGSLFGDEGSAYAIAIKGIKQALEVLDGRSENAEFLSALLSFSNLTTPLETAAPALTAWLYGAAQTNSHLAQFAPCVDRLARQGSEAAEGILRTAGRDLAGLAQVARKQLAELRPVRISLEGGVLLHSSSVKRSLIACLDADNYELAQPAAPPVIGALLVALWADNGHVASRVIDKLLRSNA